MADLVYDHVLGRMVPSTRGRALKVPSKGSPAPPPAPRTPSPSPPPSPKQKPQVFTCDIDAKRGLNVCGTASFYGNTVTRGESCEEDLKVRCRFQGPTAPPLVTVDPSFTCPDGKTQFKTYEEALHFLRDLYIKRTTVKLTKGTYTTPLVIKRLRSGEEADNAPTGQTGTVHGLLVLGDDRSVVGHAYVSGAPNLKGSSVPTVTITTNVAGVGPFTANANTSFGTFPPPGGITKPGVLSDNAGTPPTSQQAIAPILNAASISGNIAIAVRGGIAFTAKATNLQAAGAVAVIIVNNVPGDTTVGMAGSAPSVTIPVVSVGQDDGNALLAAISANPGLLITIVPSSPSKYTPQYGTEYGTVSLSHPGGNQAVLDVSIVTVPTFDPTRSANATVLEQPNFKDPALGPVQVGDLVTVVRDDGVTQDATISDIQESTPGSGFFNRLVFSAPLGGTASGRDASVTFLANVVIQPADATVPAIEIEDTGVTVNGISVKDSPTSPGTGSYQVFVSHASVILGNVTVDARNTKYNQSLTFVSTDLLIYSHTRGSAPLTLIATATGFNPAFGSTTSRGYLNVLGSKLTGVGNPSVNLNTSAGTLTFYGLIIAKADDGHVGISYVGGTLRLDVTTALYVSGMGSGGVGICGTDEGFVTSPVGTSEGRLIATLTGIPFTVSNCGVGVQLVGDSSLQNGPFEGIGGTTFSGNGVDLDVRGTSRFVLEGATVVWSYDQAYTFSERSLISVPNSSTAPNNVRTYTANTTLDHAFSLHEISGAGATTLTIDLSTGYPYLGRSYTVVTGTAFAHKLTLVGTLKLYGQGFNGATTATFSAAKGNSITLFVRDSNTVYVTAKYNVS
jgi:hypothetical protein